MLSSARALEGSERRAREDLGTMLQARWGCPRAGHRPPARLPPDLADEAEHWARVVGTAPPRTCPQARGCRPCELPALQVYRLGRESRGSLGPADILGRDMTAFEVRALEALTAARAAAMADDERIRKAQQK